MLPLAFPGVPRVAGCAQHDAAAARLGTERRRLFVANALLTPVALLLPYLTGAWETLWFSLAAWPLPLWARAALFLVVMHGLLAIVLLPLSYYGGFSLAHAFGLSRQTRGAWFGDWLKGALLGIVLGSALGLAFLWIVVAAGDAWWWVFGLLVSGLMLLLVFVMPYVLVPLFFKMRPLTDAATVARIHDLVTRAKTPVREVCSLDFSRRTAEANAAVIGLGRSRRVVIADTLLAEFTPGEVDAVVAHELGHHVHRDVQRLLVGNGVLMWLGLWLAARFALAALPVLSLPSLDYVPGFPVLLAVAEIFFLVASPFLNWWSRQLESTADLFALQLTGDPRSFAGAMERMGCQNLIEQHPPRWAEVLLATHPPLYRRIAMARSWSAA